MKTIILLFLIASASALGADARLLDAIEQVESGGDPNAVGDGGRAIGAYQIWPIMVDEVNRILGEDKYTYKDRWDREKSREMCNIFLDNARRYVRIKKGSEPTLQELGRCWNGSYQGWNSKKTIKYGEKIEEVLK